MENTKLVGERIRKARQKKALTMQGLVDKINDDSSRPNSEKLLLIDRYKSWENGTNAIPLCWIPTFCRNLECDAGYLLGEYEERTWEKSKICYKTGLSETAVDVLSQLKQRSHDSILIQNVIDTISLMLIHADERLPKYEVVPFLETLSAYLNCAPSDERIISVETDGSVKIYADRDSFEIEPGEAVAGDYMRQIIRTRLEQRVMDELRNLWNEKNGESRKAFIERIRNQTEKP